MIERSTEQPAGAAGVPDDKERALRAALSSLGSVVVAYSGGVDSAYLAWMASRTLGDRAWAVTADSPSYPERHRQLAIRIAHDFGLRHEIIHTAELERPGYRANAGDRCYFCKAELLDVLGPIAREHGFDHVATGTNADDAVAGFRPGIRAAAERGAITPLRDAGLTKAQVRAASRAWGLPTWDKPAAACLSSRVAYGIEVSPGRLARIERAESGVRAALDHAGLRVRNLRVRDLGDRASIEVDADLLERASALPEVTHAAVVAGFDAAALDPKGFRSGAMNELLPEPERFR